MSPAGQRPAAASDIQKWLTAAEKGCQCLVQAGEPSTALRIFRDLEGSQLSPNHKTVSSIISALSRLRRKGQPSAEIAYQLWTEMHQGGGELDDVAYRAGGHSISHLLKPCPMHA